MMDKINTTTSAISLNATLVTLPALPAPLLLMIVRLATILIYFMEENVSPIVRLVLSSPTIHVFPVLMDAFLATNRLSVKFVLIILFFTRVSAFFPVLMVSMQATRLIVLRINMFASLAHLTAEPVLVLRSMNVRAAPITPILQTAENA